MNREEADRWRAIIDADLIRARLSLPTGSTDSYLRARIAENEAILERLEAMQQTASQGEPVQSPLIAAA
jgi:hypothetical protein